METGDKGITTAAFYKFLSEHRLVGSRCRACGRLYLPPRPLCPACFGEELEWAELSGRGRLLAFTIIRVAPTAMLSAGYGRENPYCVGLVRLEEGPAISAQILGLDPKNPEGIKPGMPLRAVFLERGEGEARRTQLAFRP
ncbi:MAG: Zn-ribbon domain-containing OB-fold protein [Candidatus Bipolaricaulia bacterium]